MPRTLDFLPLPGRALTQPFGWIPPEPLSWPSRLKTARRVLVACDFDGTLAPIVARPEDARPLAGVVEALSALAAHRDCRVAVVSGRALRDLQRRLPLDQCWFIGGHGNESAYGSPGAAPLESAAAPPEAAGGPAASHAAGLRAAVAAAARELQRHMSSWPGARLEAKPYSLALHFRLAPDCGPAIHAAAERVAARGGFRLLAGRQLVELLPEGALTKGQAVHRLRRQLRCDLAFYFGDDTTDEDVFRFPDPGIVGIKVEHGEHPGATAAPYRLGSPSDVLEALRAIHTFRVQDKKKFAPPMAVSP